jgi:hypothetical protein
MAQFYNDQLDDQLEFERCESFGAGMDAFQRSTKLPLDAYQFGENVVLPDNFEVRTRPGSDQFVAHTFTGKIQGVFYFDTPGIEQLLFGNSGAFFFADSTGNYSAGSIALADSDVDFVAAQGVNKVFLVDGTSCFTWDGTTSVAFSQAAGSSADLDPPFGATTCVFCAGRMWAAGFAGSVIGKEDDAIWFSALLDFGQGKWSKTDQAFRVGKGEGDPLIGLCTMPASVPEQEVLCALKQNSVHIIRVDPTLAATEFQDSLNPESVAGGLGVVGKRAFAVVGNDLFYVAPDHNFYSLARMQSAAAQYQVSPPLSLPMQPYVDRINWDHANTIAVVRYKQLALFSVPLDSATTPNTIFVWNNRLQKWVGLWTGWTANSWAITRFNGVQRLVYGDSGGSVKKWKDYADQSDDATYLDDGAAIASKFWTRAFLFGAPENNKSAYALTGRASASNAVVNFTLTADNEDLFSWTKDLRPVGPNLPIDLPFDLTSAQNTAMPKGLRDLPEFSECYLKLEADSGWMSIRNLSMAAFVNTLAMQ